MRFSYILVWKVVAHERQKYRKWTICTQFSEKSPSPHVSAFNVSASLIMHPTFVKREKSKMEIQFSRRKIKVVKFADPSAPATRSTLLNWIFQLYRLGEAPASNQFIIGLSMATISKAILREFMDHSVVRSFQKKPGNCRAKTLRNRPASFLIESSFHFPVGNSLLLWRGN